MQFADDTTKMPTLKNHAVVEYWDAHEIEVQNLNPDDMYCRVSHICYLYYDDVERKLAICPISRMCLPKHRIMRLGDNLEFDTIGWYENWHNLHPGLILREAVILLIIVAIVLYSLYKESLN